MYLNMRVSLSSLSYSLSLFQLSPNEGTLRPYQTERIDVTFYPLLDQSEKGWEHHQGLACRRDYALYVHITPVGLTKQGYEQNGIIIVQHIQCTCTVHECL